MEEHIEDIDRVVEVLQVLFNPAQTPLKLLCRRLKLDVIERRDGVQDALPALVEQVGILNGLLDLTGKGVNKRIFSPRPEYVCGVNSKTYAFTT